MTLAEVGAGVIGGTLASASALTGGDLSQVIRIELEDGRVAAVKSGPSPNAEARMLCRIADSGTPTAKVLGATDQVLVMEWIDGTDPVAGAWASLGAAVRMLHRSTNLEDRYGWHEDFAFGRVPILNQWRLSWPDFWSQNRLLSFSSEVPKSLRNRIEALAKDLSNRLPLAPVASLLHGDLWTGNVMAAGDHVVALIDPACYYGHGEVDIAMLQLFGNPTADFFDHYGALEPGSIERLAIYRLWPALVHFRLFGSGYLRLIDEQLTIAGV